MHSPCLLCLCVISLFFCSFVSFVPTPIPTMSLSSWAPSFRFPHPPPPVRKSLSPVLLSCLLHPCPQIGHRGPRDITLVENGGSSRGPPSVSDRKQERRVGDPIAPDYTLHLSRRHGSGKWQQGSSGERWNTTQQPIERSIPRR